MEAISTEAGAPSPLGLTFQGDKANFALFSSHAERVFLGLFKEGSADPVKEFPLHRTGDVWHIRLLKWPEGARYAVRCEGPYDPSKGLLFRPSEWLSDPYAKAIDSPSHWGSQAPTGKKRESLAFGAQPEPFDWQRVPSPDIPWQDLCIYEMHVRGFTQHPSSGVAKPGTFLGAIEKIPHLKKLGINAVELMPVFEFDETHCKNLDPETGRPLVNYWGYNPLHFFAPMRRFASPSSPQAPSEEFKTMVREFHRNGIEVFLDVVYNHTGEEDLKDYYVNFRGLDNSVYYQIDPAGRYRNYTGCGNTLNANHPAVQRLVLDSLRYWAEEMRVDGFRFDLASILARGTDGGPLGTPPLLQAIASDPILKQKKWIAEPWDAAGLYQVGFFPQFGPWSEWNGRFRDIARRFLKGTDGKAGLFANIVCGSEWIYKDSHTPLSSVNFITSHDGFTLRDLVTYQSKRNRPNGEMNRDGSDQNDNWNCGEEGPTRRPEVADLRERQMRNFLLALFLSQGIPMLLMGDEYGHTRKGNNNPYVQDNALNWFLWDELERNKSICDFAAGLIRFRKNHAVLRKTRFLTSADIDWHGTAPFQPNWDSSSRLIAFSYKGSHPIYAAFNASFEPAQISLPPNTEWHKVVATADGWTNHHLISPEKGPRITTFALAPYSALLAKGN